MGRKMICASCQNHTTEVMSFGEVALAGAFLKEDEFKDEKKHPLSIEFCPECYLLQVPQRVPPKTLFSDYFYFSSAIGTLRTHFSLYANEIVDRFSPKSVLEIGCNDGVLLNPLHKLGVKKLVGVDPAANVTAKIENPEITVINDFFGPGKVDGKFDVIVANNVFAHIEDLNGVTKAVADALDDGVFIFEVNRLDSMIADKQYDWVYHEHIFYYSLLALENLLWRHGMMVFDLKRIGTHAGSIRYYACKQGLRNQTKAIQQQRDKEIWHGLDTVYRFQTFADEAGTHRDKLRGMVFRALEAGERVAGYGACGRANTMLQYCGLDSRHIEFIVDDAPAKQGFFCPGSHIPVKSNDALKSQPDHLILFAWSFLSEIFDKCSEYQGNLIIPLPEIYTTTTRIAA